MLSLSVQIVFLVVLIVPPLVSRWVERNLEFFFLVLALIGATLAGFWGGTWHGWLSYMQWLYISLVLGICLLALRRLCRVPGCFSTSCAVG